MGSSSEDHDKACISMITLMLLSFSLIFPGVRLSSDAQFSDFLDGLGPAQLVGRQTLATPSMGENTSCSMSQYVACGSCGSCGIPTTLQLMGGWSLIR